MYFLSILQTGIMTFGGPKIPGQVWRVRGKDLQQITKYKHLRLELTEADGVAGTVDQLHKRVVRSYHAKSKLVYMVSLLSIYLA